MPRLFVSLPDSLVLVDLETTGANPVEDRITEIAVMRVERGRVVECWQSLVNPGRRIPALIQRIIGITDDMVADAPAFAELADHVRTLLDGSVFVAHNARFDYGFIRNEYARIGEQFEAPVLCTVKLSRALYPEYHKHGLDALIERHGFVCDARHRAMGDADVLWQFARKVVADFPAETVACACERAMKFPARPPGLPDGVLEGIPDGPGVYLLYGESRLPLLIGKGVSLRARVMEHFAPSRLKGKDAELASQVRRVEWHETAGELGASLLEAKLSRERPPVSKRVLKNVTEVFGLRLIPGRKRPPILERVALHGTDPASWGGIHGTFRTGKEADSLLVELAGLYRLCPRRLGLEPGGKGACAAHEMKRCAGVCAGKESTAEHDARLLGALGSIGLGAWPWNGPVVVREHSTHTGADAWHVFDDWCLLGSADSAEAFESLCARLPQRCFDLDTSRLFQRWLGADENREKVAVLQLRAYAARL